MPFAFTSYRRINDNFISFKGGRQVADENFLSSVECYDPFLNRWIPVAPMHEPRAYCGLVSVGSYLYAIGGYNDTSWLRSVERFDPLTNQWTMLTPMSTARSAFGATVWNGRIYVTGGNGTSHALNTAEKFNPRTNTWHCAQSISNGRVGLATVTVKIPLKMEWSFHLGLIESRYYQKAI